ncbi:hypothetical protein D3C73_1561060 [compost metagenome]
MPSSLKGMRPVTSSSLALAPCSEVLVALVWPDWSASMNCMPAVMRIDCRAIGSPSRVNMVVLMGSAPARR